MRRSILIILVAVASVAAVIGTTVLAAPAAQGIPEITVFETTATAVNRETLAARTARIPVRWSIANRPPTANLVFEQVMSDGAVVNVELPRSNPYVSSEGTGVVAPVMVVGTDPVTIRLRLVNFINNEVLDERTINVPVIAGGEPGSNPDRPAIERFVYEGGALPIEQLGSVRANVRWNVINRPPNTNLIFEQIMTGGRAALVELPRTNPIVASSGTGVVQPLAVPADSTFIMLRLRLYDITNGRVLDQEFAAVPLLPPGSSPTLTPSPTAIPPTTVPPTSVPPTSVPPTAPPTAGPTSSAPRLFYLFVEAGTTVNLQEAGSGQERIPIQWQVTDRPEGSNLYFEQVMPDGTLRNIELPREVEIIPSVGTGVVAPVVPLTSPTELVIRVSLRYLSGGGTIDYRDMVIPLEPPVTPPPITLNFTVDPSVTVDPQQMAMGTARIPLAWQVSPRPENTNLFFEQVMSTGLLLNVELPRTDPIVPSAGIGVVAPVLPSEGAPAQVTIRVSLRLLSTLQTLASAQISVPVVAAVTEVGAQPTPEISMIPTAESLPPAGDFGGGAVVDQPSAEATDVVGAQSEVFEDPVECYVPAAGCTLYVSSQVVALVQQYERGQMILRTDTGEIYVLFDNGILGMGSIPNDLPVDDAPAGLLPPSPTFEAFWRGQMPGSSLYRELLGYAVSPEGSYLMTVAPIDFVVETSEGVLEIGLPDGGSARLRGINNVYSGWQRVG